MRNEKTVDGQPKYLLLKCQCVTTQKHWTWAKKFEADSGLKTRPSVFSIGVCLCWNLAKLSKIREFLRPCLAESPRDAGSQRASVAASQDDREKSPDWTLIFASSRPACHFSGFWGPYSVDVSWRNLLFQGSSCRFTKLNLADFHLRQFPPFIIFCLEPCREFGVTHHTIHEHFAFAKKHERSKWVD